MSSTHSVTTWIRQIKARDRAASQKLWERYSPGLVRLARANLQARTRRLGDNEDDVVLSAVDSFISAAESGRFPLLHDRNNLWALLVTITMRKAWKANRRANQIQEVGESALGAVDNDSRGGNGWEQVLGREPSPAFAAQMVDLFQVMLDQLSPELRSVAIWKMEGLSNSEIADKLDCVPETVRRKLIIIRGHLQKEMG